MPAFSIQFAKSAKKEFDRLPVKIQDKFLEALDFLSKNPFSELLKIKKLKGALTLYRIRIGDYRMIYEIRQNVLLILIIKIGNRKEVYRDY